MMVVIREEAVHVYLFFIAIFIAIQVDRFILRVKLEIFHPWHHIKADLFVTLEQRREPVLNGAMHIPIGALVPLMSDDLLLLLPLLD